MPSVRNSKLCGFWLASSCSCFRREQACKLINIARPALMQEGRKNNEKYRYHEGRSYYSIRKEVH